MGIILLAQVLFGMWLLDEVIYILPGMSILLWLIDFLAILYIINVRVDVGYKMIWVLLVMLIPYFGGVIYFIFGDRRPSKKLNELYQNQINYIKEVNGNQEILEQVEDLSVRSQLRYIQQDGFPAFNQTHTIYYPLGDVNYIDIIEDLKNAKSFIFMEYFIVQHGQMFDEIVTILKQKAKEGVEVRFMYDDFGSLFTLPSKFDKELQSYGIQCIPFNPLVPVIDFSMNNRDHRKITVIDGTIGYTGGINLADEYINAVERFGHWKDTGIRLEGDAVWNLTTMFLSSWNVSNRSSEDYTIYHPSRFPKNIQDAEGFVMPYGDSPLDENAVGHDVYLNMINQAGKYVYIFTPYLILNETLQSAIILAAKRGVDVRIVTPGIPDKKIVFKITRSYYYDLMLAGVKIYEYTPGFLHAKSFVCDDKVAAVGTINLDYRSLFLHFENGVYLYNTNTVMDIKNDFMLTLESCSEVDFESTKRKGMQLLLEAILRIFAPLL